MLINPKELRQEMRPGAQARRAVGALDLARLAASTLPTGCRRADEAGTRQRADIDERAAGQAEIRRDRQRVTQLERAGPDEAAASGSPEVASCGPAPADLEAAQVVAAQEEPVDDLLLLALIEQVTGTRRDS